MSAVDICKSGLTMEGDGNGIRLTEISGGTGDTEISWYDIKDTAALDSWTPGRGSVSKDNSKAVLSKETVSSKEAVSSDETDTEAAR